MKLNEKGFTLIELIAMLVVLGILMAVTVPNISGILSQSKNNILKEDISKMVDNTKVKISSKNLKKPSNGNCLIFTLDYLDDNDDYKKGPNDGEYDKINSFIIVKRENNKFKYYVKILEKVKNKNYGINLIDYEKIEKDLKKYITNTLTIDATNKNQLKYVNKIKEKCIKIDKIY